MDPDLIDAPGCLETQPDGNFSPKVVVGHSGVTAAFVDDFEQSRKKI